MNSKVIIDFSYKFNLNSYQICEFYKNNWDKDMILGNKKFYKWNFLENPFNHKKDYNCLALDESNNIVGIMGLTLRDFFLEKKKMKGAELTTWVLDRNYRGKGIGKRMLIFLKKKFDILIGSGITEEAKNVYLLNDFTYLKYIPRFFKIYNIKNMKNFIKSRGIGIKNVDVSFSNKNQTNDFLEFDEISKNDLFILDDSHKKKLNFFSKNKKWLVWRYYKHPFFKYVIYCIKNNNKKAIFVMRFDKISKMRIGYLVDIFGSIEAINGLPKVLDQIAKKKKINVIEFYSTYGLINSIFISNNWVSTIDDDHIKFMNRLYPPKWVEPATTSLILWCKNKNTSFYNFSKLYINKSDLDLDRPSSGFLKSNVNIT